MTFINIIIGSGILNLIILYILYRKDPKEINELFIVVPHKYISIVQTIIIAAWFLLGFIILPYIIITYMYKVFKYLKIRIHKLKRRINE